jgi:hypothetical protein
MLFLHRDSARTLPGSPDELMTMVKAYAGWADRMRAEGRLKGGQKLADDVGKVMRVKGGRVTVTDGPYAESKEVVGGYFMIAAKDYDEACGIAESCPHLQFGGRIELRRVDEM